MGKPDFQPLLPNSPSGNTESEIAGAQPAMPIKRSITANTGLRAFANFHWPEFARILFVLLVGSFLCFWKIGDWSFGNGDQTIHSKVVQEMVHDGHWLNPTREGKPYFNKPPLKMWIVAGIVSVFGESNTTYRFLDGLIGVFISLSVYYFARSIFRSGAAGIFAVLYLWGCSIFFWGHGVRTATQDSMMILLTSWVAFLGYRVSQKLNSSPLAHERSAIHILLITAGFLTGLAMMTKSAAGLIGALIAACFIIARAQLFILFKHSWRSIAAGGLIAIAIPALYFVPHFIVRQRTYYMVVKHEILKRATVGYHNTHDYLYYLKAIFLEGQTGSVAVLSVSLLVAVYFIFRRHPGWLFAFVWTIVPVALFTAVRSKLFWYIYPAIPGMALLAGGMLGGLFDSTYKTLRSPFKLYPREITRVAASGIALLAATFLLGSSVYASTEILIGPGHRTVVDLITQFERKQRSQNNRVIAEAPQVARYRFSRLSRDEHLYWDILGVAGARNPQQLRAAYEKNPARFYVFTGPGHIANVAEALPQGSIRGYALLPPRGLRREWLAIIYAGEEPMPSELSPVRITQHAEQLQAAFGLSFQQPTNAGVARVSSLGVGGINFNADYMYRNFPTQLRILLTTKLGASRSSDEAAPSNSDEQGTINISLNDQLLVTSEINPQQRSFWVTAEIPRESWVTGTNLVTIRSPIPFGVLRIDSEILISHRNDE